MCDLYENCTQEVWREDCNTQPFPFVVGKEKRTTVTHIIQVGEIDMRKSNLLLLGKGRGEERRGEGINYSIWESLMKGENVCMCV